MELSASEEQLLDFSIEQFGKPLSEFLLSGLGEKEVGQRWQFTITYINSSGTQLKRDLQVLSYEPADGSSFLPRGRDPLVLLSFLQLLISSSQFLSYKLIYHQESILNLLGWEHTQEVQHEIDTAMKRYSLLTFSWNMNANELTRNNLSSYMALDHLISEYKIVDEGRVGQKDRVFRCITFSSSFIECLKRRTLFNINWDDVHLVTRALSL